MSTSGGYHEYIGGCSVHRGTCIYFVLKIVGFEINGSATRNTFLLSISFRQFCSCAPRERAWKQLKDPTHPLSFSLSFHLLVSIMSARRKTISFQSPEPGFQDIQFYSRNMSNTEPLSLPKPFFQEDLQNPIQSRVSGRYLDDEQGGGPRVTETQLEDDRDDEFS